MGGAGPFYLKFAERGYPARQVARIPPAARATGTAAEPAERAKPCPPAKHARKHCKAVFVFCAEYERRPPNMPARAALLQIFVALSARR